MIMTKIKVYLIVFICINVVSIIDVVHYYATYNTYDTSSLLLINFRSISYDVAKLFIAFTCLKAIYAKFEITDKASIEDSNTDKLDSFCDRYSLTSRQRDIIELIMEGYSNKDISESLHITEGTVKTHIYNIFKKTDITSRNQVIVRVFNE